MSHNDYLKPGIAAIVLAVLFPVYWIIIFSTGFDDFEQAYRNDLTSLNWSDLLFVIIGALEVYIYWSLGRVFDNQLESKTLKLLLMIMAGLVAIFHLTVLMDLFLSITRGQLSEETVNIAMGLSVLLAIAIMVLYAITGLVFSIMLLLQKQEPSVMLKGFGVVLAVCCFMQLTIVFAPLNLFLFPIALLILGVYFLKEPHTVEVV